MRIKNLFLQSASLDRIEIFYGHTLGLPFERKDSHLLIINAGESSLHFSGVDSESKPYYHFAFNIPSNAIEKAKTWLEHKVNLMWIEDYHSYIAEFRSWHARAIYFPDPAGNVVELIARSDLNDLLHDETGPQLIRSVSEIGIVIPMAHFDEEVIQLKEKYLLEYFHKQPPLPTFRAIGDDHGLFIVVPEDRVWYPTGNIKSKRFPMKIQFSLPNGKDAVLQYS